MSVTHESNDMHNPQLHRNQLYATVSVSGDAVVIEEEDNGGGGSDHDDDEEGGNNPFHSDPRLVAVRWRRRAAAAAVRGGAWAVGGGEGVLGLGLVGEPPVSPRGWMQEEAGGGDGSPLTLPLAVAGQQASSVTRNQTV